VTGGSAFAGNGSCQGSFALQHSVTRYRDCQFVRCWIRLSSSRYTDAGGLITLAFERENSEAVITLDNGIGIPRAVLEQSFDMLYQMPTL
jgi:hypothetical protein